MISKYIATGLLFSTFWIVACTGGDAPSTTAPAFEGFRVPRHFPKPVYHFETNPVTLSGFTLGKRLFYDPILSADGSISCGSCHIQSAAFTHHGHARSHGIYDRVGTRNAPPVMNLAWSPSLMWDGGIFDLDLQPMAPIENPLEMDEKMPNVVAKLKASSVYPALFNQAFGTTNITGTYLLKALSQFMLMCVSSHSKYDSVVNKEGNVRFTQDEQEGLDIFRAKCASCHQEPLFTDFSFRNNGLGNNPFEDKGRSKVTERATDDYAFRVPSLRNLAYTAPYMHDGRLRTLQAVLEHYRSQVKDLPTLDPLLKQGGTRGIALSEEEKQKLLTFLQTLNDRSFITNSLLAE